MELHRKAAQGSYTDLNSLSAAHGEVTGVYQSNDWVRFHFPGYCFSDFGSGYTRGQDFAVDVDWFDVLEAILRFAALGNRDAQCLQAVLAALVEHRSADSA